MALQTDGFKITVFLVHKEMPEELASVGLVQFIV